MPSPIAPRENLTSRIDSVLSRARIAYVQGESGIGKTVLLAQYALAKPYSSASVFLKPDTIGLTNPSLMRREIFAQSLFILEGRLLGRVADPTDENYQGLLVRLAHRAKQSLGSVQFIVDAFSEQPPELQAVILRSILPLSLAQQDFKFVLSGLHVPESLSSIARDYEVVQVHGLAKAEGLPLLSDLGLDNTHLEKLLEALADGHPGRLAVVRRELQNGADPDAMIRWARAEYESLLGLEWNRALEEHPDALGLLAALAHSRADYEEDDLAAVTGTEPAKVRQLLSGIPFVVRSRSGWTLATPAHQEYAQKQTVGLRPQTIRAFAELSLSTKRETPDYPMAVEYFAEADEHEDVLALVSGEALDSIVDTTHGFDMAKMLSRKAAEAARQLNRRHEEFRFRIRAASSDSLGRTQLLGPAVGTLLGLGRLQEAQDVATSCPIITERFRLLARVGRREAEEAGAVHPDITASIDGLVDEVAPLLSPADRVQIGADLFAFHPTAAVKLSRNLHGGQAEEGSIDRFLIAVALTAGPSTGQRQDSDAFEAFIGEAESEAGRNVLGRIAKSFASDTLFDVLDEAKIWEDEAVLPLLERIAPLMARRGSKDATKVLARLAESVTKASTARLPRIRALAAALSAARRRADAEQLLPALDYLEPIAEVEESTPTLDKVALLLETIMVRASAGFYEEARRQLAEVFDLVEQLGDPALRLEGYALMYGAHVELTMLGDVDPGKSSDLLRDKIRAEVEEIVTATGLHDITLERPLRLISRVDLGLALDLAELANTAVRRDELTDACVAEHVAAPESLENCMGLAFEFIEQVQSDLRLPRLLRAVIMAISDVDPGAYGYIVGPVQWVGNQVARLVFRGDRIALLAELLSVCPVDGADLDRLRQDLIDSLLADLSKSTTPWEVLDVVSGIGQSRAVMPGQVQELGGLAVSTLESREILSSEANQLYALPVQLAVLAIFGAKVLGQEDPSDLPRLAEAVNRLPRSQDRVAAWERLVVGLWSRRLKDEAVKLAEAYILPELERISPEEPGVRTRVIAIAAPALYVVMRDACTLHVNSLDGDWKRIAWLRIAETLIRRRSLFDPYEVQSYNQEYTHADALELLEALDHIEDDSQILRGLTALERSLSRYDASMSNTQRAQVVRRAEQVVSKQLPSRRGIQHEGYVIWANGLLARMRSKTLKGPELDGLAKRCRGLENSSDKAFVLTVLAGIASKVSDKAQLLKEAIQVAAKLTVGHERVERLYSIAEAYSHFNRESAKLALKSAWSEASALVDSAPTSSTVRRRLIDLAYSISPHYARELGVALDDDASRVAHREVERRNRLLEAKAEVLDATGSIQHKPEDDKWVTAEAIWEGLGAVNAGLASPVTATETLEKCQSAMEQGIVEGYPAMALYLTSLIDHPAKPDWRGVMLRGAVEAVLELAEHVYSSYGRVHGRQAIERGGLAVRAPDDVIKVGDRSKALEFIRTWLETNATERIIFADGYFGPRELEFLNICLKACPRVPVHIITSQKAIGQGVDGAQAADEFEAAWREISVQRPPKCTIHVVGVRSTGKSPIHPRVLVGDSRSIMLDTSFNGLGVSALSVFTPVRPDQQAVLLANFIEPIVRGALVVNGQAVTSVQFAIT